LNVYVATKLIAQREQQLVARARRQRVVVGPSTGAVNRPSASCPSFGRSSMTSTTAIACPMTGASTHDLRPLLLERGESAVVRTVFAGMGRRSGELRFLSPQPRLTDSDVRLLTGVDECDHVAVVASTPPEDRPIGIARFIRDREVPESAEVAVAVVDGWQRRGVGTLLMHTLTRRAVAIGVRRLTISVSPDNRAVLRMLARAPGPVSLVRSDRWSTEYAVLLDDVPR
jgi:GNAT superfamily N-acetyltransferase